MTLPQQKLSIEMDEHYNEILQVHGTSDVAFASDIPASSSSPRPLSVIEY